VADQRRLDQILAEDYLAGLEDRAPAALRVMRMDCQAEEAALSYGRRILHGRLDLVRAELQGRASGSTAQLATLLAELADDGVASPRSTAWVDVDGPDDVVHGGQRKFDIGDDPLLSRLATATDEELHAAVDRWLVQERELSVARSGVHRCLDAIQSALVAAYRDGIANVQDVLDVPGT